MMGMLCETSKNAVRCFELHAITNRMWMFLCSSSGWDRAIGSDWERVRERKRPHKFFAKARESPLQLWKTFHRSKYAAWKRKRNFNKILLLWIVYVINEKEWRIVLTLVALHKLFFNPFYSEEIQQFKLSFIIINKKVEQTLIYFLRHFLSAKQHFNSAFFDRISRNKQQILLQNAHLVIVVITCLQYIE